MPSIVQIEKNNLRELVLEVKETLATDWKANAPVAKQKSFGIIDLWNCHKQRRTASSLRRN